MAVVGKEACGIWAVGAVYLEAFAGGDEAEDIVARDGLATLCELVEDLVAALAKDDELSALREWLSGVFVGWVGEVFGFYFDFFSGWLKFVAMDDEVAQLLKIDATDGDGVKEIERGGLFEIGAELEHVSMREGDAHVVELAKEDGFAFFAYLTFFFLEVVLDTRLGLAGDDEIEPVFGWFLL